MEGMSRFDLIFVEEKCWDKLSVKLAARVPLKITVLGPWLYVCQKRHVIWFIQGPYFI